MFEEAFTFDDVCLVPVYSDVKSRKEPQTFVEIAGEVLEIPIIASPMNTVTEAAMAEAMIGIGADAVIHRYMSIERQCKEFRQVKGLYKPWMAIGASGDFLERTTELYKKGTRKFCIDIANGYSKVCVDAIYAIKNKFDNVKIMAGNVCTGEAAFLLEKSGADVIRVGVGPGSACSTRLVTGFGVPQLSAIKWCSEWVKDAQIIADGGIRNSGDIVKALAMGADTVMVGGIISGTDETPGKVQRDEETGRLYKYYNGMASSEGRKSWFNEQDSSFVPEGSSMQVWYKGEAKKIVTQLNNSIKVGMSFANARNLHELQLNAKWVKITDNGRKESNPNRKMFKE